MVKLSKESPMSHSICSVTTGGNSIGAPSCREEKVRSSNEGQCSGIARYGFPLATSSISSYFPNVSIHSPLFSTTLSDHTFGNYSRKSSTMVLPCRASSYLFSPMIIVCLDSSLALITNRWATFRSSVHNIASLLFFHS